MLNDYTINERVAELAESLEWQWEWDMLVYDIEDLPPLEDIVRWVLEQEQGDTVDGSLVTRVAAGVQAVPGQRATQELVLEILKSAQEQEDARPILAFIWDFDQTLSPSYMQEPLFRQYGVDGEQFWRECGELFHHYQKQGIQVTREACYLNHILTYVQEGIFAGLNNAKLRELGADIQFVPGLLELLAASKDCDDGVKVEHYVVSAGLTEMIRGSAIASFIDGIWACEFIDQPHRLPPDTADTEPPLLRQIARIIDNTGKTRALFEINKGVNIDPEHLDVDQLMPEAARRIPFQNMVYIADGLSDIPAFSVVGHFGGQTLAVYDPDVPESKATAEQLHADGRANSIGPADYRQGTPTRTWLDKRRTRFTGNR